MKCAVCDETHAAGSASDRECEEVIVEKTIEELVLGEYPFFEDTAKEETIQRAYDNARLVCDGPPEIRHVISAVASVFPESEQHSVEFWRQVFVGMPAVLAKYAKTKPEIEFIWQESYTRFVLAKYERTFIEFETESVLTRFDIQPVRLLASHMRETGDELLRLALDGYEIYDVYPDHARYGYVVSLRRRKKV